MAVKMAIGIAPWLHNDCPSDSPDGEDIEKCAYNRELVDPLLPSIRISLKVAVWVGVVLDFLCYKYRFLSGLTLYHNGIV